MGIIWSIIIGLIVGAIAKLFMPGKDGGGIIITILIGIAGSVVFTYLGRLLGFYAEERLRVSSLPYSEQC